MNVVMLARGIVPVHAAAFNFAGHGVLVTGWSHGSKTGTLLSFMAEGAEFVGDEWIYISARGNRMYGLPDHLEARPWYLRELPRYQRNVSAADRLRISVCDNLARVLAPLVPRSERHNSLMGKAVRHAHQLLSNQQLIDLRPLTLFGAEKCPLASSLDTVIVTVSHEAPDIVVEPTPVEHVAKQMAASFQFEQASLTSCYLKHLFAFPDRRNELLDQTDRVYTELALKALNGKTAYTMLHPYPVSTQALQRALLPLLGHPPNVGQQGPKSSRQSSGGSHS